MVDLPSKKILYFHNITPPRFLQVYDAEYADHCADGIAQLKHLERFDLLMANSISSARVLQSVAAKNHAGHPPGIDRFSQRLIDASRTRRSISEGRALETRCECRRSSHRSDCLTSGEPCHCLLPRPAE